MAETKGVELKEGKSLGTKRDAVCLRQRQGAVWLRVPNAGAEPATKVAEGLVSPTS